MAAFRLKHVAFAVAFTFSSAEGCFMSHNSWNLRGNDQSLSQKQDKSAFAPHSRAHI